MRLNFHVQGVGDPLIILHGLLGSSENWRAMSKRMAAHFKVYCLDLRNHGASPHSGLMHYSCMADDLREFFANEHINRAHLLGHSIGGKVAMQFTAENPKSITKLVVIDIAPKAYPPTHMPELVALKGMRLSDCKSYTEADHALQGQIFKARVRQFLLKNLARGPDHSFHWRIGLDEIIANYDELTQKVNIDRPIANPTCFIRAGRSDFITDTDVAAIRALFPNAEIVTFPDSGHWVHVDVAQQFYEYVTGFLLGKHR